jgi:hypothetical protein
MCITLSQVLEGVVPNEHGTWFYGRNGWCDGQDVRPVIFDITADLMHEPGGSNEIAYFGLFRGGDPSPQQTPGFIMMQSSLVLYQEQGQLDERLVPVDVV